MYLFFTVLCRAPSLHWSILNICRVLDYMAWFWFMEWLILVYIINRIIHGRLEIWNLSSRVHIRYLTRSLRSFVRYRCEHSKINSISPRDHVLFSIFYHIDLGQKTAFHNFSMFRTINRGLLEKPFKKFPKSAIRPASSHF